MPLTVRTIAALLPDLDPERLTKLTEKHGFDPDDLTDEQAAQIHTDATKKKRSK